MVARLVPGAGRAEPRGASLVSGGVNFSVYSETAETIWVCLFDAEDNETGRFALERHADHVFCGLVTGIGAGTRYGLRAEGPYEPDAGLFFDPDKLLVDPFARVLDRAFEYDTLLSAPRGPGGDTAHLVPKAIVEDADFEAVAPVHNDAPGLVYELNVRGFTKLRLDVAPTKRGTVKGLMTPEVLDHFKKLGVDVVELMPIAGWIDERHLVKLGLKNAWGYNPVNYFAPDLRLMPGGMADLRAMTDLYRAHGIRVIVDVVYNHTGESDVGGPVLSYRGLDPTTYYRHHNVEGRTELVNDTGTGNTLQCDHPEVQRLVIESLRYWVEAGGVSGFRFDLAPILGRDGQGFDAKAKLLERIQSDPVLGRCLLVMEPWDPGPGGYHLGDFTHPYLEWNDQYRDAVRAFWRGEPHAIQRLAHGLAGSEEIFGSRTPNAGVNFLAVHDGFTLMDTVSYAEKHNQANGEGNRDGHGHNLSWNNGVEGATDDAAVLDARRRDVRALLATLFVSRGVPMIQQGDEMGRTQLGNNNAYAQDNDITWVDWAEADEELVTFVAELKAFRDAHLALTRDRFLSGEVRDGVRDVVWLGADGKELDEAGWHDAAADVLGMHLNIEGDEVLVWFNRRRAAVELNCPNAAAPWRIGLDSSGEGAVLNDATLLCPARTVVALVR